MQVLPGQGKGRSRSECVSLRGPYVVNAINRRMTIRDPCSGHNRKNTVKNFSLFTIPIPKRRLNIS